MDKLKLEALDNDAFWAARDRERAEEAAKHADRERRVRAEVRKERLAAIPARYSEEFRPSLSKLSKEVVDYCRNWDPRNPEGMGIGLFGDTGMGKTRLLCRILFRLDCSWLYLPAFRFSDLVGEQWSDGMTGMEAERMLKAAHRTRVLFLDDLGDERHSDTVSSALKGLVEHRTSRKLPTLWTSNLSDDQLAAKHGERGPAIVRRLAEFSWTP